MRVAQKEKIFCDVCGLEMNDLHLPEPIIMGYFPVDPGGFTVRLAQEGAVDYKDVCQTCYDKVILRAAAQIKEKRP